MTSIIHSFGGGNKLGAIDVEFIGAAMKEVINCRRFLQWTYAHGYFLRDESKEKVLFQFHQGELEWFCDQLHGMVEKNFNFEILNMRPNVLNYTKKVQTFRLSLEECISSSDYPLEQGL